MRKSLQGALEQLFSSHVDLLQVLIMPRTRISNELVRQLIHPSSNVGVDGANLAYSWFNVTISSDAVTLTRVSLIGNHGLSNDVHTDVSMNINKFLAMVKLIKSRLRGCYVEVYFHLKKDTHEESFKLIDSLEDEVRNKIKKRGGMPQKIFKILQKDTNADSLEFQRNTKSL